MDGDGLQEIVPESDRVGAAEPTSPYVLISQTKPTPELKKGQQRFYLGGTIYESWAAVPTPYKTNNQEPDSRRSTGERLHDRMVIVHAALEIDVHRRVDASRVHDHRGLQKVLGRHDSAVPAVVRAIGQIRRIQADPDAILAW